MQILESAVLQSCLAYSKYLAFSKYILESASSFLFLQQTAGILIGIPMNSTNLEASDTLILNLLIHEYAIFSM